MLKFSNMLLGTENPEPLVAFYTRVLGKPTMEDGGFTGWGEGGAFLTIGQHSEVHGKNADPARAIWFFETTDVKGEFDRIKGLGAQVIKEPYEMQGGFLLATLADPDGNYFQLASPFDEPAGS
jgi:predicted enzyme related to lactoylglutathione lyase